MLKDGYGRNLDYLRISVTDACNYRCIYCGPEASHGILDNERLLRLCRIFWTLGVRTVRLTGGEPLLREKLVELVGGISGFGFEQLCMTTNGSFLASSAMALAKAGLDEVNVSLDATDGDLFAKLSGGHEVSEVISGIDAAQQAGMQVRLNCVPLLESYHDQVRQVMEFAKRHRIPVRFIELMPIGNACRCKGTAAAQVIAFLKEEYGEAKFPSGLKQGSGPTVYRRFGTVDVGIIGALTSCFCLRCNRLRLTSNGLLRACLYHPESLDVKRLLACGADDDEIRDAIRRFVLVKPLKHDFSRQEMTGISLASIGG